MGKLRVPYAAGIVMRTVGAGWVAAIYGALYIYATADFAGTGTLWIFGWPFLLGLSLATLCHLLLAGMASPYLRSPVRWVNAVNEIFGPRVRPDAVPRATLESALTWLPSAPVVAGALVLVLSGLVVLWMAALEWIVAGSARNVGPVLVGGIVAALLYGATTFTLSEALIAAPCQRLRMAAVRRDLDPYLGQTVDTRLRVAILAAPTVLALLVAPRLTANLEDAWLAHSAIVFLATALTVALAWMHAWMIRQAAIDLGEAARRLAGTSRVSFVTGAIDGQIVEMARAFNVAASELERSQQNAAARYGALFEGAGDAIFLVEPTTGGIIEANRRAHELTGLSARALKATRFEWLFRPGTRLANLVGEGAAERSSSATIVRADGSERPVDVAVSFVALAEGTVVQAIMHDVAQRERAEQELRISLDRLKELYQLAVTLGGTVEQVAERVAGTLAALLDVPLVLLERHVDGDLVMLAMYENGIVTRGTQMALAGTPCGRVHEDRRAYLTTNVAVEFPEDTFLVEHGLCSYVGVPIVGRNGEVVGAVAVMDSRERNFDENDVQLLSTFAERLARVIGEEEYVREREAFVQQLTAQNVALMAAKEHLTEADRLKSMFMGMMSHELRTPLNIFLGYTELLLDTARDDGDRPIGEHGDVLERMLHAAGVLTNLVEDTLSVLRLESTGVRVNREPVVLATLFEELQSTEQALHPTSEVEERWCVEPELGAIETDRLKIRQIVTNLVGNARKFTTAGSIAVEARAASDGRVVIAVTDTGCGIPPEDLPHIFELYRQAADGETRNGCGIGLFIVQRYCSLLGGHVDVSSELDRGTRFTVWLPRTPVPEGAGREEQLTA